MISREIDKIIDNQIHTDILNETLPSNIMESFIFVLFLLFYLKHICMENAIPQITFRRVRLWTSENGQTEGPENWIL